MLYFARFGNFNSLYIQMLIELIYSCGVEIIKCKQNKKTVKVWISVPEHSNITNSRGQEVAGDYLAKCTKDLFQKHIGVGGHIRFAYEIRKGDVWTQMQRTDALSANIF